MESNTRQTKQQAAQLVDRESDAFADRELSIEIWEYDERVRWAGSKAQLLAEGLIPPELVWPKERERVCWNAENGIECSLNRIRPPDLKGPMKLWTHGDYWCLFRSVPNNEHWTERALRIAQYEFAVAAWKNGPVGRESEARQIHAMAQRCRDKKWMRFWDRIEALGSKKRGV